MRKNSTPLLLVLPLFLVQACLQESSLSDIEITDPSLLKPQFTVKKIKTQSSGRVSYRFEAELLDRRGRYVTLLNGAVYLNGFRMSKQKVPLFDYYTYRSHVDDVGFRLDSAYAFTIVMSDGASYTSSVKTPATDLVSFTAFLQDDTARFQWTGNNTDSIEFHYAGVDQNGKNGTWHTRAFDPMGQNIMAIRLAGDYVSLASGTRVSSFRRNEANPAFSGGWARASIELR